MTNQINVSNKNNCLDSWIKNVENGYLYTENGNNNKINNLSVINTIKKG